MGAAGLIRCRTAAVATSATMVSAPAECRAAAADLRVDPVVYTSSTSKTCPVIARRFRRAANLGPDSRPMRLRDVCGRLSSRESDGTAFMRRRRASALASISAGSNPRERRRFGVHGTHVTMLGSAVSGAIAYSASAMRVTSDVMRRYFSFLTRSAAAPSCGQHARTASMPTMSGGRECPMPGCCSAVEGFVADCSGVGVIIGRLCGDERRDPLMCSKANTY